MANEAVETDEIDVADPEEVTEEVTEQPEGEQVADAKADAEPEEVVITIGDESPPSEEAEEEAAAPWVKELRKKQRETARENRELKAQLAQQKQTTAVQAVTVGAKPTLEGVDYDTEKFEADLTAWHERKRQADAEERKKQDAVEADKKAWLSKLETYGKQKSELRVSDYEDAEAQALESLNVTQQGIILSGSDNPAVVVYALGKNPTKAKELASINDPVKFAFAVAKLETQLKVTPRKTAPLPETRIQGSARVSGAVDSVLERLRAEADVSGNRSKVVEYMAKKLKA